MRVQSPVVGKELVRLPWMTGWVLGGREEGNQFTQKVQRPTQRGLFVVSEDETKEEAEGKET